MTQPGSADASTGAIDVAISHPEKVLFPDSGITKGELSRRHGALPGGHRQGGLHPKGPRQRIVVPVDAEAGFELVWRFALGAGAVLVKRHPTMFTQELIKADRAGRISSTRAATPRPGSARSATSGRRSQTTSSPCAARSRPSTAC